MKTNFKNFNVGDTVHFIDKFDNYSSLEYNAVYTITSKDGKIIYNEDFIEKKSDGSFEVNIPFTETIKVPASDYQVNISFTNISNNFRMSYKLNQIKVTDLNEQKDIRSYFEIALENVRACIAKNANPLQKSYKYKDRELSNYDYTDLLKLEAYLSKKVQEEENKKKGFSKGFYIYTRYNKR